MHSAESLADNLEEGEVPVSTDVDLVLRAQRDRAAFAPLYARYADLIYRYCYRRLDDADTAADATSQIFIKAITGLPGCKPDKFRSWLFAIAHNVTIDSLRERRPVSPLDGLPEPTDHNPGPEEVVIRTDEGNRLRETLTRLPTDQRRVLELRLAGLTTTEIAESMGRTRGAIDTAQCRAVQRLRVLLNPGSGTQKASTHAIP